MKIFNLNHDTLNFNFEYNSNETELLSQLFANSSNITIENIRRIALWKLDRILNISDEIIQDLHKIAEDKSIRLTSELSLNTITALVNSEGVGFPMASTILKFIRPDIYPIMDVRAYRALYGKKIYYNQYSLDKYLNYTKQIYVIAQTLKINLNTVDEQLYMFDKIYNGKI
ncbi:MAG: hypothetical protein LRY52_00635 [Sulfurospirillum cavolei]|nr:hypothetical protein [Sulfurospirillum cavolei]